MKTLKNCITLSGQVKIYVPSTNNVSELANTAEWVDRALGLLSKSFGGATATKALGAWVTNGGSLVKEDVTLVMAFCEQSSLEVEIDAIYQFCVEMKVMLSQEAIALEVNGNLYLV